MYHLNLKKRILHNLDDILINVSRDMTEMPSLHNAGSTYTQIVLYGNPQTFSM